MANLKTEVILTMNGKAAIQVLEALRDKAKSVREEIDNLDEKAPDFKQRKAGLEEVYKALQSAETDVIKGTERLDHALQNLTSTSLQNLRKALGDGRRQLQSLSEDDLEEIEEIRKKMKLAGDQVRLLEGQYVKIPDGLKNIKNQSDQWLDKAIKQQRDLVGSLEKSDASYQKNLSTLKQLVAEEDRRKGKMSKSEAMSTVSNKYANASELRRAKTTITEVRDKTDSHKVDEIEQYNKALLEIDKRLGSISGQFVDVQKGISNVSNQSDQWLDKAIKQQRDLVGSLEKSDASYQQNLATLKQLEAEEDRRKGKMSVLEARQTVNDSNASASDLRRAKTTLTEARDKTSLSNTGEIDKYNNELQEIEKRLEAVSGKAQKASMSWKQMKQVLAEPNKASGEDIKRTMEIIAQKIQQLPAGSKYVADLRRQYAMLEQTLKGTRMSQSALNDILTRSKQGKASIDELRRAYKQLEEELNQLNTKSKEFADKQKSMKELKKNIDEVTGAANKQGGAWRTAMKNLIAYVGLFGAFDLLKSKLTEIFNLNFKLGDQLADIRKVSGWAMNDINELSKRLAKIDTRNTIQQLNDLAYQGAKLGIGKYGVDGLSRFAEATAQIRMALHEDMGDEAIAQLAKMAEVMGDMSKLGVSQSLLASGSAIFKLSATTTACGSNIMEFSKRLLGLGKTADLTTPQILALGSAADSMALMPEVASTAFNKFITTLQSKYAQVAKAVGMNQDRLKSLLDQHQTMEAIVEVLEHMRGMGDLNALAPIMGDLGSEGARLTNVFASMAANVDMLKEHLTTSEDEFRKATAVTAEFDIQNETSQALLERANNIWEKSFVNSDNAAGGVKDIAMAWYDMTKAITGSISFMKEAGVLMKGLTYGIQVFIGALPALINGLIYFGAIKLTAWLQMPVLFGIAKTAVDRVSTSVLNLVGIQTAAQKSAIATASANQATAESMYAQALSAKDAAVANQALAVTQEEMTAANAAVATANADLIAAQEMLAASTVELSAVTKVDSATLLEESETKILDAAATVNLTSSEAFLTENKGMATAMINAEAAAVAKETAAKEANITATKNMRMVWGAVLFVSFIALIDKLYDNFKKLNAEEERNKEVTDKIANGLATANKEYEDACKNLRVLYGELERNWNQMDERKRLIGEINAKYGDYVDNLVTETTKMSELTGSYNDATDALREYYYYKQKEALRADLVTEEQHKGDVSFMKLQNMGGKYKDSISLELAKSGIEDYAKEGVSVASIADNLWHDFFGGKAPGSYYMDLSKLPLIGGAFPKNTFRSEEQEAMTYLNDFVKHYVIAMNSEGAIEKNFPGEWTPPERKRKKSKDNSHNATTPEDDSRANISEFITKIKNLYARQITAATEKMTADGIEKELQEQALDDIKVKRDTVLAKAQQAIVLGKAGEWDSYKKTIAGDIIEQPDEYGQSQSLSLLESINTADVRKMRADLLKQKPKIKKGKVVGLKSDESDRAYLDKEWLKASKNEGTEATVAQKRMEKRRKELLEHSYTGVVKENSFLGLVSSGYAKVNLSQLEKDKGEVFTVLERARQDLAGLFSTNAEKDKLLKFLFGENYEQTPDVFASLLEMSDKDAALFYQKLIQYSDEYAAAEKKQYDDAKKITDFLWKRDKRNLDQQEKMRKMQNESKMFGKRTNLLSNLGLANLTADPEIELMKARMQAAENYYAFVERNNKNQQLLAEAERARQEAELAYVNQMATAMKSRLSQMKELVQPIEDFGAAVGQALAEMRYDAESANDAIKSALKSMLESWAKMALNDVNTQMWKAINDAGAKRGKKNAQPDIEAARANADANAVTMNTSDIGTAGNPAHVIVDNETKPSDSISDKKTDVVVHSEPGGPDALPTVAHKDSPMATSPILVPNNTERHGAGGLFKSVDPDTMPSYPSKDKVSAELPVKIGDDNVVDSHSNSQEKSDLQHEPLSRVEEKRKNNFPSDFHPDQYPEITVNSKKESPVPTVDTKTYEPPANAALKRAHNTNNPQNEENREGVVGLSDIQENVRGILEVAKDLQSKVSDRAEGDVGSPTERTEEPDSSANSTSYSDPAHRTKKALPTDAQESQGKVRNSPSNQRKGSTAFRGTAEQAGSSVADAITGQSSLAEAGAGIVMGGVNAALNADLGDSKKKEKEEKQRKKQLREEKKHQKALSKEVKQGTKEREKTTDKGVKNMTVTTEQGNKEQSKGTAVAQQTMLGATDAVLNTTLIAKQKNNDAMVQSDAARTEAEMTFSIAGAMAKCFEFLGPIAGPIAAAVVMSTLMGLLQWALGSALGGKKKNSTKGPNTKVVSGMLTYDSGNVQDLRPFVGNDGSLYWATEDNKPHDGVSLLTQPTATTINGQPSLVAENGPELVIGRETTQAMMMNNPQLLKALVNYDRNYSGRRAYDNGNIAETSATITPQSPATDEMVSAQANTNIALLQAVNTLLQRLEQPIEAKIDMYGRGKLYDSMTKANQFMKNK